MATINEIFGLTDPDKHILWGNIDGDLTSQKDLVAHIKTHTDSKLHKVHFTPENIARMYHEHTKSLPFYQVDRDFMDTLADMHTSYNHQIDEHSKLHIHQTQMNNRNSEKFLEVDLNFRNNEERHLTHDLKIQSIQEWMQDKNHKLKSIDLSISDLDIKTKTLSTRLQSHKDWMESIENIAKSSREKTKQHDTDILSLELKFSKFIDNGENETVFEQVDKNTELITSITTVAISNEKRISELENKFIELNKEMKSELDSMKDKLAKFECCYS
ncbi:hypothetical protein [Vibrio harveyi]|uniref:hypothetical protein n=1 Tax=Vibrio harveyi TaxID=669 RepID=UPI003CF0FFA1